jgi:cytochrome c
LNVSRHPGNDRKRRCAVIGRVTGAALAMSLFPAVVQAQDAAVQRGRAFADANCGRCHAVGRTGDSPLPRAPPFRTLHQRYPVDQLAQSLAEGIRTAHPAMPQFELDAVQIDDLIAYLKSLER